MRITTRATIGAGTVALLVVLLLSAGCVQGLRGLRFSHRDHAGEAQCIECHADSARAGHAACVGCHDIAEDEPSEDCLVCHTEGDYRVQSKRPDSYADVAFDHSPHEDVDCQACHAGAASSRKAGNQELPSMKVCTACHDGDQAPAECSTCHDTLRRDKAPADHSAVWEREHGAVATIDRTPCAYCHQETGCEDCHKLNRPRSHTPSWKNDGHGIAARHDRNACVTCHQADMCSRCHQLKPASHYVPNFGIPLGPGRGHGDLVLQRGGVSSCQVCHDPGFCARCHN